MQPFTLHRRHAAAALARLAAFLGLGFGALPLAADWTPEAMLEVATITATAPSPDGSRVAWVESRALMTDSKSLFRTRLLVTAADGGTPRQYTFGDANADDPQWSPDGAWLAYRHTANGGKPQLAVIAADGGGERLLTEFDAGIGEFRWAPDSTMLAFVATEPKSEAQKAREAAGDDAIVVGENPAYRHLWRIALPTADAAPVPERITTGAFSVGTQVLSGSFDWSPDAREIAFTRVSTPDIDDWPSADIAIVDVSTGRVRPYQQSDAAEWSPVYSPDGKLIAFSITNFPPSWIRQSRIGVAAPDGKGLKLLAATGDEQPSIIGWTGNRALLASEAAGTTTALWRLPVSGAKPARLDDGKAVLSAIGLNSTGTQLAFAAMTSAAPQEVALTPLRNFAPLTVSTANANLPARAVADTRRMRWKSSDGLDIEGLLTLPTRYVPGTRYPLLLIVHGGPAGVFQESFLGYPRGMYPLAAFADAGYALLRANPRGSSGYGHGFRAANASDWGGADYEDLMAGVDAVIDQGVADPDRLGVMGWSYGGFMTSWIITRTDRFRAASIGAPVTDLVHMEGTTDIRGFIPDYFGGHFWQRETVYRSRSPLLHVDSVTTPALIQHGQADERVPLSQGTALYRALQARGIDTRMVIYPRAPHGPREPRQLLQGAHENLDWFGRYLPAG